MVVQGLSLHTPKAGDPGSIPNQGTRFHILQLKILNATKTLPNKQMGIFNILFNFGFVAFSSCNVQAFHCGGFSCCRAQALERMCFSSCGSQAPEHGLSSPAACRIFPDQKSNQCPLHCKVDFKPLDHQGRPKNKYFLKKVDTSSFFIICSFNGDQQYHHSSQQIH